MVLNRSAICLAATLTALPGTLALAQRPEETRVFQLPPGVTTLPAGAVMTQPTATGPLTCRVVDRDGKPVADARLFAEDQDRGGGGKAFGKSNAAGEVTFAELSRPGAVWRVHVWKEGFAFATQSVMNSGQGPALFTLAPSRATKLRVVDQDARPLAGARITLSSRILNPLDSGRLTPTLPVEVQDLPEFSTQTDENGAASVNWGAAGDLLTLRIRKEDFQAIDCSVLPAHDEDLSVRLLPAAKLCGRLLGPDGQPLAKTQVRFLQHVVTTDEEGKFLFSSLTGQPGMLSLPQGDLAPSARMLKPVPGQTLEMGEVKTEKLAVIRGQIKDAAAATPWDLPTHIRASLPGGPDLPAREFLRVDAEKDGKFQMRLPAGDYAITAHFPNGESTQVLASRDGNTRRITGPAVRKTFATQTLSLGAGEEKQVEIAVASEPLGAPRPQPEAAPTKIPDYISGKTIIATGQSIGAVLTVMQGREVRMTVAGDENGNFEVGPLLGAVNPGGAVINLDLSPQAPPILLVASAPGYVSQPLPLKGIGSDPVTLTLERATDFTARVTDTAGNPLRDARVTVTKLRPMVSPPDVRGESTLPLQLLAGGNAGQLTDARGLITLGTLPPCYAELRVERSGYATHNHVVALPYPGAVKLPLSKAATIQGFVRWDDGRPYEFGKARVKVQAWTNYPLWLTGDVNKEGAYKIEGVPSLEMLGDESLAIDLIIDGTVPKVNNLAVIAPGLTARSLNPGSFTLLVTDTRTDQEKRWISYVQAQELGLKFQEGAQVNHDMELVPLALLKGKLVVEAGKKLPQGSYVTYQDPRNTMSYAMPRAEVGATGDFEIWVPATEEVTLTLHAAGPRTVVSTLQVKNLKPQERREVEWKTDGQMEGQASPAISPALQLVRVVGPDGATVPGATLQVRGADSWTGNVRFSPPRQSRFTRQTQADGSATLFGVVGTEQTVNSPLLDAPVSFSFGKDAKPLTIRLNALPQSWDSAVPTPLVGSPQVEAPTPVAVGQPAPPLRVSRWVEGGPVELSRLRGKIVVLAFYDLRNKALADLQKQFPEAFAFIRVETPNQPASGSNPDKNSPQYLAVGVDTAVQNNWQGVTQLSMGGSNGYVVLDQNGTIAAANLPPNYMVARIKQLLALGNLEKLYVPTP